MRKAKKWHNDISELPKGSEIIRTRYFWRRRLRQDSKEYWLKIRWKAAYRDFYLGWDGTTETRFCLPLDTIHKTDKIAETIVLKTLDIRQQSKPSWETGNKEDVLHDYPSLLSWDSFYFHPRLAECTFSLMQKDHLPKQSIFWAMKQVSMNLKGLKSNEVCSETKMKLKEKSIRKTYLKTPKYLKTK